MSKLELTKKERNTLFLLLLAVVKEDVIDLLELFSREDFNRVEMIIEKLKQQ